MKALVLFFSLAFSATGMGSACCAGGGPKSFISLQQLQSYEIGLSTSLRDAYGSYSPYGEPEESDANQTLSMSLGAGIRFLPSLEAFAIVPWVYQQNHFGRNVGSDLGIGDLMVGARYLALHSLFRDDWYPSIYLTVGSKAPTGTIERVVEGHRVPGTGNGLWEPFLGIGLKKEYGPVTVAIEGTYTARLESRPMTLEEGDKIDISESLTFPVSRRFSIGGGSLQSWTFSKLQNGIPIENSAGRYISAFATSSYFLTQVWSITAGVDVSIPMVRFGVNQPIARTIALTTRYGFY